MLQGKSIAVVIPAFNEEKLIKKTLTSIPNFVDEIHLIDDASSDNTLNAAKSLHLTKLSIHCHSQNEGVGGAIITGYKKCLKQNVDIVVVMGGDNQMHPDDLHPLLTPLLLEQADYSKGDRLSFKGVFKRMPFLRFMGNHGLSLLTKLTSGYFSVRDSQCGYTAITTSALNKLHLDAIYTRYGFPNDFLAHLYVIRARLAQVTVQPIYADEKSGISLFTAFFKVPAVILRSWAVRKKLQFKLLSSPKPKAIKPAYHK